MWKFNLRAYKLKIMSLVVYLEGSMMKFLCFFYEALIGDITLILILFIHVIMFSLLNLI